MAEHDHEHEYEQPRNGRAKWAWAGAGVMAMVVIAITSGYWIKASSSEAKLERSISLERAKIEYTKTVVRDVEKYASKNEGDIKTLKQNDVHLADGLKRIETIQYKVLDEIGEIKDRLPD